MRRGSIVMRPLPYLAAIGAACGPLVVLIASDRIAARKVVLLSPLLSAFATIVFGFFWTPSNVADCTDCKSSLTVFDFDVFRPLRSQHYYRPRLSARRGEGSSRAGSTPSRCPITAGIDLAATHRPCHWSVGGHVRSAVAVQP